MPRGVLGHWAVFIIGPEFPSLTLDWMTLELTQQDFSVLQGKSPVAKLRLFVFIVSSEFGISLCALFIFNE